MPYSDYTQTYLDWAEAEIMVRNARTDFFHCTLGSGYGRITPRFAEEAQRIIALEAVAAKRFTLMIAEMKCSAERLRVRQRTIPTRGRREDQTPLNAPSIPG